MKIFHHNDLDGILSAAIILKKYPQAECYEMSYTTPFDWSLITNPMEPVFMVDFGLQPFDNMIKLNSKCKLIWIDHHITAISEYEKSGEHIEGLRKIDKAGCQCVYEYLYPNKYEPIVVTLLGAYDIYNKTHPYFTWDEWIVPFEYGMRKYKSPHDNIFEYLLRNVIDEKMSETIGSIISNGKEKLIDIKANNKRICEKSAFVTEFEGLTFICLNGVGGTMTFESVYDPKIHDGMLTFLFSKNIWLISMFTDKDIDLSILAKKMGGGGHKQACGFQCKQLPFNLPVE